MLFTSVLFVLFLIALPQTTHAINEPIYPATSQITGLWSTGIKDDGTLVDTPPPSNFTETSAAAYAAWAGDRINHQPPPGDFNDPHWVLTEVENPPTGRGGAACERGPYPRPATTIHPPLYEPPDEWVWWRHTVDAESKFGNARWVGTRTTSYHDNYNAGIYNNWGQCDGNPRPSVWTYKLKDGFNVGGCVNLNTVEFRFRWAVDNDIKVIVNGNEASPVLDASGQSVGVDGNFVGAGQLRRGYNDLEVKVHSGVPLTGFAIEFFDPNIDCEEYRPYMRVYGNDVMAGGGFADSAGNCGVYNPTASIMTFDRQTGSGMYAGSGVNFAAFALGLNRQFFSASTRNGDPPPTPKTGLTFGNHTDTSFVGDYGGNSGISRCVPDYYGTKPATATGSIQFLPDNSIYAPAPIPDGERRVVYVDGDVFINNDIQFANSVWPNKDAIPSFYLIARGNIYIDDDVTQLDGVYIAQPTGNSNGIIYTCASPGNGATGNFRPVEADKLRDTCDEQLVVHGSFMARQVKFLRTNGTVENANPDEPYSADEIAEVFDFSNELYLAKQPSVFNSLVNSPTDRDYDSITSLPPVL